MEYCAFVKSSCRGAPLARISSHLARSSFLRSLTAGLRSGFEPDVASTRSATECTDVRWMTGPTGNARTSFLKSRSDCWRVGARGAASRNRRVQFEEGSAIVDKLY